MRALIELWKPRFVLFQVFSWRPFYFTIFKTEHKWLFVMFFYKNMRNYEIYKKSSVLNLEVHSINLYYFAVVLHKQLYKLTNYGIE